ncbi:MAG: hypothetical protein Q9221_000686 [Calogaya cf. arnoldii]
MPQSHLPGPANESEVRSERLGTPRNDNEHDLLDACLAALDAQLHEQSQNHASTAAITTTEVNHIQNQSSAMRESGRRSPSPSTNQMSNARALPSASFSHSLPFRISATEIGTSYPLNTMAEPQGHTNSTNRKQGPTSIRHTEAASSAATDNDHDLEASTDITAIQSIATELSTQQPTSSSFPLNTMASNVFGASRKRNNDDNTSANKRTRKDEEAAAQVEIEAGNLVDDNQSKVPGASNHSQTGRTPSEDPIVAQRRNTMVNVLETREALVQTVIQLCLALDETKDCLSEMANRMHNESRADAGNLVEDVQSNVARASIHSQTDREPSEDPFGDQSENTTVDLLEVGEALERTAIQLCLALVETKDGINEMANRIQDEDRAEKLLTVCKEIASCINGALEELIGHPDALERVLNSLPDQTVQDFNGYRHDGLSTNA